MKIGTKVRVSAIMFKEGKLVLTKHEAKGYGIYYLLPGGGVEHAESLYEALKREVMEECGVGVTIKRLVFYKEGYTNEDDYLELMFLCEISEGEFVISKDEKNVQEITLVDSVAELKKIKFFPKQIIETVFKELPKFPLYLGKFKYPEG